ncbi:MAG: LytTR family transcriptional regulator DNA-binding domain-containing protein [Desulfobulbus sp.]|nr:LytTR family transcriptional regulator DNA-binding domain-containing protein [Desulfobulbus sp.]
MICLHEVEYVATCVAGPQVFTADDALYTEITLKVLEKRAGLLRCHKQHLVNMENIREIVFLTNGAAEIHTLSHQKIPVSRRFLKNLKQRLLL